jgi:hypothetical protein
MYYRYIIVNTDLIPILTLEGAVYYSELSTIHAKAKDKNKLLDNGFIKLDRNYIEKKIYVSVENQLKYDESWKSINLISKDPIDTNVLKLNEEVMRTLLGEDKKTIQEITVHLQSSVNKSRDKKGVDVESIKASIRCDDPDLLPLWCTYVDSASQVRVKNRKLTLEGFKIFEEDLIEYANGNKNVLRKLIRIAISAQSLDSSWVTGKYEKSLHADDTYDYSSKEKKKSPIPLSKETF